MSPPLRERPDDILPLAGLFLRERGAPASGAHPHSVGRTVSKEVEAALLSYDYPGNVRELKSIIERACILAGGGDIRTEHLLLPGNGGSPTCCARPQALAEPRAEPVAAGLDAEAVETLRVLSECRWHRGKAAAVLGISYSALRWRINKYGLKVRD